MFGGGAAALLQPPALPAARGPPLAPPGDALLIHARRQRHEEFRALLQGATFIDVEVTGVLGQGCNGAVLDAVVRGVPVAAKVMYNFGMRTTLVKNILTTEYRPLQQLPHHPNIVAVLAVIRVNPLTQAIVDVLPEAAREAAVVEDVRNPLVRQFRSTVGLLLERLPMTLEKYVRDLGADLDALRILQIGTQIVDALLHLKRNGVVHGDMKLNNIMMDASLDPPQPVLVDFGCAVLRGERAGDMDEGMDVHAVEATNFALGNQAHLAPEVLAALTRKGQLARGSAERVTIPLAKQPSFEAGVVLHELALGLRHPVTDYPLLGNSEEEFARSIDTAGLREVMAAGAAGGGGCWDFEDVVVRLLAYDPARRLGLAEARARLDVALATALSRDEAAKAHARLSAEMAAQLQAELARLRTDAQAQVQAEAAVACAEAEANMQAEVARLRADAQVQLDKAAQAHARLRAETAAQLQAELARSRTEAQEQVREDATVARA